MDIKKTIDNIVWYIPFKKLRNSLREYLSFIKDNIDNNLEYRGYNKIVPIGHYESPYPPEEEIKKGYEKYLKNEYNFYGINMNDTFQLDFLDKIKIYFEQFDLSFHNTKENRWYDNNGWFNRDCALYLFGIINYIKPKKIIEIGSGFSTSLMLDINNNFFNNSIKITSIEPRPQRLKSLLRENDNLDIMEINQQDVPLEVFNSLEENDLLFIDSSHVSRPFSDVNRQFFEILPNLNKGVIIHIHDVRVPFEYPAIWTLKERRAYNEVYLLRAFLQYNSEFDIIFFPSYLNYKYPGAIEGDSNSIFLIKK